MSNSERKFVQEDAAVVIHIEEDLYLCGDVLLKVFHVQKIQLLSTERNVLMFRMQFNTLFLENGTYLDFNLNDLDGHKGDKLSLIEHHFDENFKLRLMFTREY